MATADKDDDSSAADQRWPYLKSMCEINERLKKILYFLNTVKKKEHMENMNIPQRQF